MFYEHRSDGSDSSPDEFRVEYLADLRSAIEGVGIDRAVERTGIDRETLARFLEASDEHRLSDLTLTDAAAIQSLAPDTPDRDDIVLLARDHLLLGMSNAIVDVDALDRELDHDFGAGTIQRKLEGDEPMTFEEFVRFQHAIARKES